MESLCLLACVAKGTNKKLQKCDRQCMVLVNMHRTGERRKNLLFLLLASAGLTTPNQASANFQASHTQSGGSARPWFLPHAAARMSGQGEQRPGLGKKAPGRRIQQKQTWLSVYSSRGSPKDGDAGDLLCHSSTSLIWMEMQIPMQAPRYILLSVITAEASRLRQHCLH